MRKHHDVPRPLIDGALEHDKAYIPTRYPNAHPSGVPAAVLLEMALLEEAGKIRLKISFPAWVDDLFTSPGFVPVAVEPVHVKDAWAMRRVADPFDRLIVAAAKQSDLPLISRDADIARSQLVELLW